MSVTVNNPPSQQPMAASVNQTDVLLIDQVQPGGIYATRGATVAQVAAAIAGAIAVVAGPAGAQGAAGAQGNIGPQGAQGQQGQQGPAFDPAGTDLSLGIVNLPNASNALPIDKLFSAATPIEALGGAAGGIVDNGAALIKAAALGIPVTLGVGTYLINGECDLVSGAVIMRGIPGQTIITRTGQGAAGAATLAAPNNPAWLFFNCQSVTAFGIIFDGNATLTASTSWGLLIGPNVVSSDFDQCVIRNVKGNGYAHGIHYLANQVGTHRFNQGGAQNCQIHGLSGDAVDNLTVTGNSFTGNGNNGVCFDSQSGTPALNFNVSGNICTGNGAGGLALGAQDIPGSTDPTLVYGASVYHVQFGTVSGNFCAGNNGYDMIVAGARDVSVTRNSIGANGFNGNCSTSMRFSGNIVDAGTSTTGFRIGVDMGGAIDSVVESNTVRGDWLIGVDCGSTINLVVRGNDITSVGACVTAVNVDSGGTAGGGTSPFGTPISGMVISGNRLNYSAGSVGVQLIDAPVGISILDNVFIDSQLRPDNMVSGYAPLLRARGNLLLAPSLLGTLPAIGGTSSLPMLTIGPAGEILLPLGSDRVLLTVASAFTIIVIETIVTFDLPNVVTKVTPTAAGSGYGLATTCTITGDGAGATADVLVYGGKVVAFSITNPGSGYTTATVAVLGAGTGALASAVIGAALDCFDYDQTFEITNLTGSVLTIEPTYIATPGGVAATLAVNRTATFRFPGGQPVLMSV